MGKCPKCNREVLLKGNESTCPNCGEEVEYHCESCAFNFQVKGQKQCTWCGFYFCPECGCCSTNCESEIHIKNTLVLNTKEAAQYYGSLIHSGLRRNCPRYVPKTYAKQLIPRCISKITGENVKNPADAAAYNERHEQIRALPVGTTWAVSQLKENGSHGQEMRETLWLGVCEGYIKAEEKTDDKKKEPYWLFTRIDKIEACPHYRPKNIRVYKCPRCKKQSEQQVCDICKYQKGIKKGQPVETIKRKSRCHSCQLDVNLFNIKTTHGK
jgi:hypothetical protein